MARFRAFLSYNRDADNDRARDLESALRLIGKRWYALRSMRVFRDRSSLAATSDLSLALQRNLAESDNFVLLASPGAARSPWVRREVEWWLANRSLAHFFIVITDGDLVWSSATNDFDWAATTAVPDCLAGRFGGEPGYVDLRWARKFGRLSRRHPEFRSAALDIAAPLLGRSRDELDGDDIRQRRWLRLAGTIAVGLILVFAVYALFQASVARRERNVATARQLAAQSQLLLTTEPAQIERAVLLAVEAARRLASLETDTALRISLPFLPKHIASLQVRGRTGEVEFDRSGEILAANGEGKDVRVWELRDPGRAWDVAHERDAFGPARLSPDGTRLLTHSGGMVTVWNRSTRSAVTGFPIVRPDKYTQGLVLPDWSALLIPAWPVVHVYPLDGTPPYTIRHPETPGKDDAGRLVLGGDGHHFATIGRGIVAIWQPHSSAPVAQIGTPERGRDLSAAFNGNAVAVVAGRTLALYTYPQGVLKARVQLRGRVPREFPRVELSPSAEAVAIGEAGEAWLAIVDPRTGEERGVISHPATIGEAEWFDGGAGLITADGIADSVESQLQMTRVSGSVIESMATVRMRGLPDVIVSAGGRLIAASDIPGPVRVWDTAGTELARIPGRPRSFSPDGRLVAVATDDGRLDVWDVTARVRYVTPSPRVMNSAAYRRVSDFSSRFDVRVQPCGVVSCDGGRVAALVPAGEAQVGIQMEPAGGYDSEQSGGEWRGATYRVTRDGTGGAVHVFDRWSGADLLRIPIEKTEAVGFSATGAYLAAFTGHQIRVWRASDGAAVATRTTEDEIERFGFAAGDTVWYALLKTGDDITGFESGRITPQGLTRAMAMKGVRDATVCEANGRAWLGENDTSVVVDAGAGTRLAALPVGAAPQSQDGGAGFSRDCTRIAAADGSDVVVWNASNGRELRRIRIGEPQRQWTFTPDGAALVTIANPAGSTGSARVWDLESGAEVARLGAQHELDQVSVWHVFFTDDNAPLLHLIIGHTFGTSMMPLSAYWRTADLIELACKQLGRNLTSDEWTAYLGPEPFRETCPRGSGR